MKHLTDGTINLDKATVFIDVYGESSIYACVFCAYTLNFLDSHQTDGKERPSTWEGVLGEHYIQLSEEKKGNC